MLISGNMGIFILLQRVLCSIPVPGGVSGSAELPDRVV